MQGSRELGMPVKVHASESRMHSFGQVYRMGRVGVEKEANDTTVSPPGPNSLPFFKQDGLLYALGVPSPRG